MAADILLADFGIRPNDVVVANDAIFDLGPGLNQIPIPHLRVQHIALDAKHVVAAYFHDVVLFRRGLEHDHRTLFDDVVVAKNNFEVLLLFLADYGAGGIYDAALAEDHVSHDFVQPQVQHVCLLQHLR